MKYILSNNILRSSWSFVLLLIANIVLVHYVSAQQNFWVPKDPPEAHYEIDGTIDTVKKMLEGKEDISFTNTSSRAIAAIAIDWTISKLSSIEVRSKGNELNLINQSEDLPFPSPLIYELPKPADPGAKVKLRIIYSLSIAMKGDMRELKLTKWYPRLWWDGLPVSDVFRVKLNVPEGYACAMSGRLNRKTGYYENSGVCTFGVYLCRDLKTEEREVDGVLITAFFTEKGSQCARLCLETAADAVKFYKDWLGFYPFTFLNIIPGGIWPVGGYPFASGIVVIHGQEQFEKMPLLHWKWITAHEIGHQYWGEYVMDDDIPRWLWIGMGIYADREYTIFRNIGMGKHEGLIKRYLRGVRPRFDTTVDLPPEQVRKIKFDRNNIVVHGKGYAIVSALEYVLGKETFQRIYKRCLRDYGRKRLGYREFWRLCEEESGENLKWFFDQWIRSNKYLYYDVVGKVSVEQDDKYISYVKVESKGKLKMPLPVKAVFEDGTSQVKYTNRISNVNHLQFESTSKLEKVILDPENKLAMINTPLPILSEDLEELISKLSWVGAGVDALDCFKRAKILKLEDRNLWFKLGMTLFDGGYYEEGFEAFKNATELRTSEIRHFTSLVWMGHIKDLLGEREEALTYYIEALKHDTGKTMRHDQYGMKINRQWIEERLKEPFVLKRNNK
ncbi:MAG: M1 family aminopeptidase [Candidatus Aminicenantaceae bacterium]